MYFGRKRYDSGSEKFVITLPISLFVGATGADAIYSS